MPRSLKRKIDEDLRNQIKIEEGHGCFSLTCLDDELTPPIYWVIIHNPKDPEDNKLIGIGFNPEEAIKDALDALYKGRVLNERLPLTFKV